MSKSITAWRDRCAELWPINGDWIALAGEYDLNFKAADVVYKIMRAGCSSDIVDLQIACLRHLENRGLPVPSVVNTREGASKAMLGVNDEARLCWAISALPGKVLAETKPLNKALIATIGQTMANLHIALEDFQHPALQRTLKWDLRQACHVRDAASALSTHPLAGTLDQIFTQFTEPALAALSTLPIQAIHNDLNDYNLLCQCESLGAPSLSGVIDFGDMIAAPRVCDLSIAAAYLMLRAERPFETLFELVEHYAALAPLNNAEIELIWPLILTRMAVSAVNAHESVSNGHQDPYLQVSQLGIRTFLETHATAPASFVEAGLRQSAGLDDDNAPTVEWIAANSDSFFPLFGSGLDDAPVLDLSIAGRDTTHNPIEPDLDELCTRIEQLRRDQTHAVLGKYREARLIYGADFFLAGTHQATDRRTMHIAIDVFLPAGSALFAPLDGVVHSAEVCDREFDYGGLIVLRHEPQPNLVFYTLYGHLQHASAQALTVGEKVARGKCFGHLGSASENGGWPPHVHFQWGFSDQPGSLWPGVVDPDLLPVWQRVFPDPAPLLGLPAGYATGTERAPETTLEHRRQYSPASLRTSYATPLQVIRGWRSLLFDECGRTYLDAYNNVPHVGHSHPRIRQVVSEQLRFLNTNTRYLQAKHADYSQALVERLPEPLSVCFLLSSGSEANELALRLAEAHTGSSETIALRAGYHGHTKATIDISDYKFAGPGGTGKVDWVHIVSNPDTFRGQAAAHPDGTGAGFADEIAKVTTNLAANGKKLGCFIAETFPSVGGQIIPPPGYLQAAYRHVHEAGGVCIADEVQTGLGRLGEFYWGFEQQQVVPDIVVLGKPLGNGYPLAAVVTTPEIAASFDTGMEFFATFGGATVACVAGHEVLRIIDDEKLAEQAASTGAYLLNGLRDIARRWPLLADVRGMGLFIGVELTDNDKQPLPAETRYVVNRLREKRILIGSDGPDHNVLKIRPPLCFSVEDVEHLLSALEDVLAESALAKHAAADA